MASTDTELSFTRFDLGHGVRLAVNPTHKLKTVVVKALFTGNLDEAVTHRALVPLVLRRGTRSAPDMQAVQRRLEGLYGASIGGGVAKVGEWHALKYRMEAVNGAFLPGTSDVVADSLRFLREMLFEPLLADGAFVGEFVEQEKENLGHAIDSLLDSKDHYALEQLLRAMASDRPFRRYELGTREDLAEIDAAAATDEWRRCVERFPLDLYVCGDVDPEATRDLLADVFAGERPGDFRLAPLSAAGPAHEPRLVEERMPVKQGKLCMGYRVGASYAQGDLEAAVLMSGILGGYSHSKLFQNVREKASLAYDAHAGFDRHMGFVFISCGIAVENYERARSICEEQVAALQRGEITEDELVSTRESLDNQLTMIEDNPGGLMDVDHAWGLHGRAFDLEGYRAALRAVTAERVQEVARTLELDTVYFLRN